MVGITSYGVYIPYNRLERKCLTQAYGKKSLPGEKAVACYDEDSLTMAVSAALNSLNGKEGPLDAIYYASTTAPYKDKQSAAHIASVLDEEGVMRTADFGGSLRAGASAMLSALDVAEKGERALVTVADSRLGGADGPYETAFGDAAAAFTFGSEDVVAEYVDSYSAAHDFMDVWRHEDDRFVRYFDERFAQTEGFVPFVLESIRGLLEKTGIKAEAITTVVLDASSDKKAGSILKKAGIKAEQLYTGLIADFGYSGAAYAPVMLCGALEQSKPGDLILYVSYGEGSDAILFKALDGAAKPGAGRGIDYFKNHKKNDMNYEKYLRWKKMLEFEPPRRPGFIRSSLPDFYRKRKKNLACYGSRCTKCGTPHFPASRICVQCKAIDQMEPYRFLGRKAQMASYTFDYIAYSEDPPNVVAIIDFEGGGRMFTNLVDCELEKVEIGMPVDLAYRKMFTAGGINTYFWKCVPADNV